MCGTCCIKIGNAWCSFWVFLSNFWFNY
jgi:hypothetical protein